MTFTSHDTETGDYESILWEYTYDDKHRITSIIVKGNDHLVGVTTFSYVNNQIVVNGDLSEGTYSLDNNGYVIRVCGDNVDASLCEYSNGYIVKERNSEKSITYSWENGNLIKIIEDDGFYRRTRVLSYNNVENKLNIGKFGYGIYEKYPIGGAESVGWFTFTYFDFIAFKGWTTKNFPVSETWSYREGNESTTRYTYTFDSDGYPTQLLMNVSGGVSTVTYTYY